MSRFKEATITTIRPSDLTPGMAYPYIPAVWDWEIRSIPLASWTAEKRRLEAAGITPTLRLVKDDKVLDIHVPEMSTAQFLAHWGLDARLSRGGYVLSKRLSRLMHPHKHWAFLDPSEVHLVHRRDWDADLWDGCGRISRRFIQECLLPRLDALPEGQRERYERELLQTGRFEITVMHAGGQEKGDVLVVDELPGGADLMFPYGSAKAELRQSGQIFVGLPAARQAKQGMRVDVQSLINLHPFLEPEQLLAWLRDESALFLDSLATGEAGRLYTRLGADEESLAKLSGWHVAEYLASGGDPRWFTGVQRALGQQHLTRLEGQVAQKLRLPAPGGRYYIFPAAVGERSVPRGHITLDHARATAWVNDEDWCEEIVALLGGCDGDDALWVLPFHDVADDQRKVLCWRSPNQVGEYVLLAPTEDSDEIRWALAGDDNLTWPELDSRRLPPRIDEVAYEYAELESLDAAGASDASYSVAAMDAVISLATANQGILGAYCNLTLVTKALYGALPTQLPATLETIIDGSVKRFIDLGPVRAWVEQEARAILGRGTPVPASIQRRLATLLPPNERRAIAVSEDHWLDHLLARLRAHQVWYTEQLEEQVQRAVPPIELFAAVGEGHLAAGRELRQRYAEVLRRGGSLDEARDECEQFLASCRPDVSGVLVAAAAACYTLGKQEADALSDAVLWQLGEKLPTGGRQPGIAQAFIQALREIGLLGEPVWTTEGAQLSYVTERPTQAGEVVTLNGVWLNLLRATWPDTPASMGEVPEAQREAAKQEVTQWATRAFGDMRLKMVPENERLVGYTPRGNVFGYVQRGHESRVREVREWRIAWATATDGNVHAVLRPVSS